MTTSTATTNSYNKSNTVSEEGGKGNERCDLFDICSIDACEMYCGVKEVL